MPNSKLRQIQVGSEVYDIQADSVENQNHATGALSDKFDWIGTQSEYIDQDIENQHPDWFCYITDDVTTDSGEVDLSNYAKTSEVSLAINTLLSTLYPVGSLYIGTQSTNPMTTLIPGSSWSLVATNRALWGSDGTNANTTIEAGLPNITATWTDNVNVSKYAANVSGAVTQTDAGDDSKGSTGNTMRNYTKSFDASRSNPIYGNSSTVQPAAYRVNVWRRTA